MVQKIADDGEFIHSFIQKIAEISGNGLLVDLADADASDVISQVQLQGRTEVGSHMDSLVAYDTFASLLSTVQSWRHSPPHVPSTALLSTTVHFPELFCANVSTVMLLCLVGFAYQFLEPAYKIPEDGEEHNRENLDGTWRYRLFDVAGDRSICCISCCCPVIRFADTVSMSNILGFWATIFLIAGFIVIAEISMGIGSLAVLAFFVYCRQTHRHLFSMTGNAAPGTVRSCVEDCFTMAFCSCCAIIQEARQMEEAHLVGHAITTNGKHSDMPIG